MSEPATETPARPSFTNRVAERAPEIRVARLLLSLLALPFYVIGFVAGLVLVAARWCLAAVLVGMEDAKRQRAELAQPVEVTDAG